MLSIIMIIGVIVTLYFHMLPQIAFLTYQLIKLVLFHVEDFFYLEVGCVIVHTLIFL